MKENIIKLRKLGYSYKKIKKELGCALSTISYHCVKNGLNSPNKLPVKITNDIIKTIQNDYLNNTAQIIANKLNISKNSVYKYCGQHKNAIKKHSVEKICLNCNSVFKTVKKDKIYCCNKCRNAHIRKFKIESWLKGELNGNRGSTATAYWIKIYLIEKHGEKCMECNWSKRNKYTNKIPIELEHIDGNYKNNKEENLKLLCPNCHSLTSTYRGLNKGNGRPNRKY